MMTVRELIDILSTLPQDATVLYDFGEEMPPEGTAYAEIVGVEEQTFAEGARVVLLCGSA